MYLYSTPLSADPRSVKRNTETHEGDMAIYAGPGADMTVFFQQVNTLTCFLFNPGYRHGKPYHCMYAVCRVTHWTSYILVDRGASPFRLSKLRAVERCSKHRDQYSDRWVLSIITHFVDMGP